MNAIVHLVDSVKADLTLSTRELTMGKDSDLAEYFQDHIRNSLCDPSTRTATFAKDSKFAPIANTAITSPAKFVETSKEIAKHLYKSSDKRISSGAVAICLYSSPQEPKVTRFLAVLKLDPADGFHPVEKNDGKGNVWVEFEKVEDVVPSSREKLLKCAFIRPRPKEVAMDYDMVVLDRQSAGTTNEPAKFFMQKFLGAEHFGDSSDMTKKFYSSGVKAVEMLRPAIGNQKAEDIRKLIDAALTGKSVDIGQWVGNLTVEQTHKDIIAKAFQAVIPDGSFDVDENIAKAMVKKRTFRAHGFQMTIDADEFDDIVKQRTEKDGYDEIILHIPDLKEVAR
ncbi:nucleoid-associated protein [Neorhodopirellula lusitana]|uniref:nucleoid-associated protein n=1 Tax=Neorhodopirellula lusitana TaxID=445327 RepID=UPI0024B68F08|nr:nucleoid-associated protein [Neorhodopirellula lusitana]